MTPIKTIVIIFAIIFGFIFGSFLNVCIYRIPNHESLVTNRSHCTNCGKTIKWYDLIPVISYLILRGRCRYCKEKISCQYILIELLTGICFGITAYIYGLSVELFLFCAFICALIVLSVIDFRTYEIPLGCNIFILILGVIRVATDFQNVLTYLIGAASITSLLLIIYFLTRGKGIGGGDIKLMFTAGLLLGWQLMIVAFILGCALAVVIHLTRMIVSKKDHLLAFGPYLSLGLVIAIWVGKVFIKWYLEMR